MDFILARSLSRSPVMHQLSRGNVGNTSPQNETFRSLRAPQHRLSAQHTPTGVSDCCPHPTLSQDTTTSRFPQCQVLVSTCLIKARSAMGVHHRDGYDLLREDTKTWDKAGPPDSSVCHGPIGTATLTGWCPSTKSTQTVRSLQQGMSLFSMLTLHSLNPA